MTNLRRWVVLVAVAMIAGLGGALLWGGPSRLHAAEPEAPVQRWDDDTTWRFDPARDDFSAASLLDLRYLNEKLAGETGFVRVDANGDFVRGDGQPIRFWAVNSDVARSAFTARPLGPKVAPDLARHARFLAKRGVNMVRQHRQLSPLVDGQPDVALQDINEAERDAIWRMVAAMRAEGIYSTISPYWAVPMKFAEAWGIVGGAKQPALGLLFFDESLQAAYKTWWRKLLTEPNPYTGVPLVRDASVAILQLQNEDSLLFWTAGNIAGPQRRALEQRYADFLARKHGSVAAALGAWQGERDKRDSEAAAGAALIDMWELTRDPKELKPGRAARLADQTEFLARTMERFNREMVDFLRKELGVRSLVNAGNWKTASAARLNDAERWSYLPGDVDAVNRYNAGVHQGSDSGWAVVAGDRYTSPSALLDPTLLPVNIKQTVGRPMLVTEGSWVMPHAHAAEGPWLVSAYSSLNGVDGYCWFSTSDEGWSPPQSANGYLPSQEKWSIATPETLGGFPAAALAYRLGLIARAPAAVTEQRALTDLWQRRAAAITEESGFDPNRDAGDAARRPTAGAGLTPLAFLTGPVQVGFGIESKPPRTALPASLIDRQHVRSATGELQIDFVKGVATLDAPRVQGVSAFFARAPKHRLSQVDFESANDYGAALAVSLDGQPIGRSQRVLVQYATQSRPEGWADRPVPITVEGGGPPLRGRQIDSYGKAPWRVVKARLQVTVRNPALRSATVLDMNGVPAGDLPLRRDGASVAFDFPASAMYVLLR
jgi:hypothetical protein